MSLDQPLVRWRLVLGSSADASLKAPLDAEDLACDAAMQWLYDRESEKEDRDILERRGGHEASALTVPSWLNEIHRLFPKETIERLERDAVERYQIRDLPFHVTRIGRSPDYGFRSERVEDWLTLLELRYSLAPAADGGTQLSRRTIWRRHLAPSLYFAWLQQTVVERGQRRLLELLREQVAPSLQVSKVAPGGLEQFFILDIVHIRRPGSACEEREVGDELPESQLGGMVAEFRQGSEQIVPDASIHWGLSPIVGSCHNRFGSGLVKGVRIYPESPGAW